MTPLERLWQEREAARAAKTNKKALEDYLSQFDINEQEYVINMAMREITRLQMEVAKNGKVAARTA